MKTRIQSYAARIISSDGVLTARRNLSELKRALSGRVHTIDVFLKIDDPYSYVLLQALEEFSSRFDVEFKFHIVSKLQDDMFPEPELWHQYAFSDAAYLASLYQFDYPENRLKPSADSTLATAHKLIGLSTSENFIRNARAVLQQYWSGANSGSIPSELLTSVQLQLDANDELLKSKGHYLSATLYYNGEWYWGLDRLAHLEQRLINLGLVNENALAKVHYDQTRAYFCKRLTLEPSLSQRPKTPLELYFSARSPYSYLGLERCVALAKHYDIPLLIKPVLPMMMRNVLVPPTKKWYIFHDTKREAKLLGIDYGFVADPLGVAVERCYSLFDYAKSEGREIDYLLSFSRAVNANGVCADTDAGLKQIVEESGLSWQKAKPLLKNTSWRKTVDANFEEMHKLGLWGVPSMKFGNTMVWGQDRIDIIEQSVAKSIIEVNG